MARTFPRTLLEKDLTSEAERRLFQALRDQLPDALTDDEPAAVAGVLDALGGREEVRPQDVVVLSGYGRQNSHLWAAGRPVALHRQAGATRGLGLLLLDPGFKGLEAPVVVLCEFDNHDETRDSQLDVGPLRARNHCVVVAPATS
jgi:hypothetical protein